MATYWRYSISLILSVILSHASADKPFIDLSIDFDEMREKVKLMDQVNFTSSLYDSKPDFNQTDCSRIFLHAQAQILSRLYARFHSRLRLSDSNSVTISFTKDQIAKLKKYSIHVEKLAQESNETLQQKCKNHGEILTEFTQFFDDLNIAASLDDHDSTLDSYKEIFFDYSQLWIPLLSLVSIIIYCLLFRPRAAHLVGMIFGLFALLYVISLVQYFALTKQQFFEKAAESCGLKHPPHITYWESFVQMVHGKPSNVPETPEQTACIAENAQFRKFMDNFDHFEFLIQHWGKTFFGPIVQVIVFNLKDVVSGLLGGGLLGTVLGTIFILVAIFYFLNPANLISMIGASFSAMIGVSNALNSGPQPVFQQPVQQQIQQPIQQPFQQPFQQPQLILRINNNTGVRKRQKTPRIRDHHRHRNKHYLLGP